MFAVILICSLNLQKHFTKYQVENLIEYANVDMRQIPFEDSAFDVVAFKSVLGALNDFEDQNRAIHEIKRVLKSGGVFVFAENTRASKFHSWMRNKFAKWKDPWRYSDDNEFKKWSALFTKSSMKKEVFFDYLEDLKINKIPWVSRRIFQLSDTTQVEIHFSWSFCQMMFVFLFSLPGDITKSKYHASNRLCVLF